MAFLCPARIKKFTVKAKRRRVRRLSETDAPLGRITGSASIDTLVRVGLEKEQLEIDPSRPRQRVLVLHDFQPCVDDELAVSKGQSVTVLYRENDWLYVVANDGKEGFVPYIYCAPQGTTISDDIQVGARSTYLTNGSSSPTVGAAKDRKNHNQHGGGGPPGAGGGGGDHSRPRDQSTGPSNSSYQNKTSSFQTSPNTQKNHTHGTAYYNYNKQVAPHNISNTSAPPGGNNNMPNTSTLPLVRNTARQSYTYGQPHRQGHNTNNSFARGNEYNSSRMSNNRTNSSYKASMSQSSQSNDQEYMNMDNRSRHARFQNHKYENVHVRNGLRAQGHARHSSEDRTYGQQRQSQVSHTRYHSLDRSGYGVYNRDYRPLQNGRHRHSSHDQQAQSRGNRQRSQSHERNQSYNMQGHQGQGQSQGRGGQSRTGQGHPMHVQQLTNVHRHLNNMNTSNIQGAGHHIVSSNNHYKQNSIRSHGPNRTGQQELDSVGSWGDQDRSSASDTPVLDTSEVTSFVKRPHGRYIVLFPFTGQEEGDVGVNRGEFVTVLNKDDADWFYIRRADGSEGFVPSSFLCPAEGQYEDIGNRLTSYMTPPRMTRQVSADSTRLVCLYDYAATAPDDLSITRGEWLYADLQDQVDDSWLWAYSPGTKRYGYVPRAYAKPPNTNGLIANPLDPYLSP